jgi:hypothetical protein
MPKQVAVTVRPLPQRQGPIIPGTYGLCQSLDLSKLQAWVTEAYDAHYAWRANAWEDSEFADGMQWTYEDTAKAKAKRIRPLTINRTFPVLNLLHGYYLLNRTDIVAKGRTQHDTETGQIMTESIKFISDQNSGAALKSDAFKEQITAGFSTIQVGFSSDPRDEKVQLRKRSWTSVYWDPYASPWLEKDLCRYVFTAEWQDLDDLNALFPGMAKELQETFDSLAHGGADDQLYEHYTQSDYIEDVKDQGLSASNWVDSVRERVKPVEMWHTRLTPTMFAIMPSGYAVELTPQMDPMEQLNLIQQAQEVTHAVVKKMHVTTFLDDLVLQDCPSPYTHDQYPFAPYVGYLDRFAYPFGVVRQIKEQNREVNQRRSMGLALLSGRRVYIEKGAAEDNNRIYAEAQRFDGFMELKRDKLNRVKVEDLAGLAAPQIDMLRASEREISEISGATQEALGQKTASRSGTAMQQQKEATNTMTASLLDNAKRSETRLGQLVSSLIQSTWTGPRVLRITDSVAKTERFVNINERIETETGIEIRNDITQGNFDIVVTTAPETDTTREANIELLFAAINKAPPEAIGSIINLALELSDIPNKEFALRQIRETTGYDPSLDQMTQDERQQYQAEKAAAAQEEQRRQAQINDVNIKLEQEKTQAETEKLRADAQATLASLGIKKQDADTKSFQVGAQVSQMNRNNQKEEQEGSYTSRSNESHPPKENPDGTEL